jgi:hypothetical protein
VHLAIAPRIAGLGAARIDRDATPGPAGRLVEVHLAVQQARAALDAVQRGIAVEADPGALRLELERVGRDACQRRDREA